MRNRAVMLFILQNIGRYEKVGIRWRQRRKSCCIFRLLTKCFGGVRVIYIIVLAGFALLVKFSR